MMQERFRDTLLQDVPDDLCDSGCGKVANHETDHGILRDECFEALYGKESEA